MWRLACCYNENYIEIFNFRHFFKHIAFNGEGDKIRNKVIKNHINVSVAIDLVSGNTRNENQSMRLKIVGGK